jgi:hypothetical protein
MSACRVVTEGVCVRAQRREADLTLPLERAENGPIGSESRNSGAGEDGNESARNERGDDRAHGAELVDVRRGVTHFVE